MNIKKTQRDGYTENCGTSKEIKCVKFIYLCRLGMNFIQKIILLLWKRDTYIGGGGTVFKKNAYHLQTDFGRKNTFLVNLAMEKALGG